MSKSFLARSQTLSLPPLQEAEFWLINLEEIQEEEICEAAYYLDRDSLDRAQRFRFEEDQHRSIIVHAALRFYLGQLTKQKPSEIAIDRDEFGKPYLKSHSLHFNLSHTASWALLGFHPHSPLGVDIEVIQEETDIIRTSETIFYASEKELLDRSPNPQDCFFTLWCAKEALLKALGTGFSTEPLPVLQPQISTSRDIDIFISMNEEIYVYSDKIPTHKLAVCLKKQVV